MLAPEMLGESGVAGTRWRFAASYVVAVSFARTDLKIGRYTAENQNPRKALVQGALRGWGVMERQ
jgi:hypothetical protein